MKEGITQEKGFGLNLRPIKQTSSAKTLLGNDAKQ